MIIVVGSINLDLIATVDRLPGRGETVPGDAFKTSPGGKGANQALAARRAGAEVSMVGAVGRDPFADTALACLREGLVDVSAVREAHASTGTALILVELGGGDNVIAVVPGANATVKPADFRTIEFSAEDVLLVQNEIPPATIKSALEAARKAGAKSIYNVAPFREDTADCVPLADYLVANETEFDLYAKLLGLSGADRRAQMQAYAKPSTRWARVIRSAAIWRPGSRPVSASKMRCGGQRGQGRSHASSRAPSHRSRMRGTWMRLRANSAAQDARSGARRSRRCRSRA